MKSILFWRFRRIYLYIGELEFPLVKLKKLQAIGCPFK